MEDNHELKAFLAKHPRMMGVLFTLALLMTQITAVAARGGGTTVGP